MAHRARFATFVALLIVSLAGTAQAQYAEQNVNMVAGTSWPHGDPYLQRQNEPSIAVSTRNPLHLLGGANDYRTVDIPFDTPASPDSEERGDAWLGVFKSRNGGQTWWSDLLDGYPQQNPPTTSPLRGFQAGADAVVRSGQNGMFYYAGLVLNRDPNPLSGVFVARFIDDNRTENGDPFVYLGAQMIDKGTSGAFIDKPWIAVGPGTGQCTVKGETFPAQNVYLAYTTFVGGDNNIRTKLMFARSTDCGATWSAPQKLSEGYPINQGASIVVSPIGPVYVVWRLFKSGTTLDSIMVAKSIDNGATFTKASVVKTITPFEQGMTATSIRTNAYPAATADANGRLYVVWSDRGYGDTPAATDGRIVMVHSADGLTNWTGPTVVDPNAARGHQFMPAITNAGGRIVVTYYDLRDDSTRGTYTSNHDGTYNESREALGDRLLSPSPVFSTYLQEYFGEARRHTLDLRATQMNATMAGPSYVGGARISRYVFGSRPGNTLIEQLQYNPPNYPLFRLGTAPFIGDYIDVAGYSPKSSPVYHIVWTDNRDVRPPADKNWANYTPVGVNNQTTKSTFDNTKNAPQCSAGNTGMRNQNIYTSRVTDGVFAGSIGNAKPLNIQRAFAVFVQNTTGQPKTFRLTIATPPPSGYASFDQFNQPAMYPTSTDVSIPPHSTATRTVYVFSTSPTGLHASVNVDVTEVTLGTSPLTTAVVINPDVTNPDVTNPDVTNPDVTNPDVTNPDVTNPDVTNSDVHTPDVTNPDVTNPDVTNPDVTNPDVTNPDVTNPDVTNPDVTNPDVTNPDVTNPDVTNPDVTNTAVSDTSWTIKNKGNTTSGFAVKLTSSTPKPPHVKTQLIINRRYQTPAAKGCNLGVDTHYQILSNIIDPTFTDAGQLLTPNPDDATVSLYPFDAARITLRVYIDKDPVTHLPLATFDAATAVTPVVVAQANDFVNGGIVASPSFATFLPVITTSTVPDAIDGIPYTTTFTATGGKPAYTWSAQPGTIERSGVYTNTFGTAAGQQVITVTVTDAALRSSTKTFPINVYQPLQITTTSLPPATVSQPFSATLAATGGKPPYTFGVYKPGPLPAGLSLNPSTGQISGTPTVAASGDWIFSVSDTASPQQFRLATLHLSASIPAAGCASAVTVLFDNSNAFGVGNGGTSPQFTTNGQAYCVDSIWTYHWNGGNGATPGTIGLNEVCIDVCTSLGPWQAAGSAGQGNAPNVNWTATPPANPPVIINGTYLVADSDPATWSQNRLSGGNGFTIVYGRAATYTVQGRLTFNGAAQVPTTTPQFFVRNETSGQQQNATVSWTPGSSTFTISGLPAGTFGVEVASQETASGVFYPGGFYSWTTFDAASASQSGIDVNLRRLLHLTAPNDNGTAFTTINSCGFASDLQPNTISWTGIPEATSYTWSIDVYTCTPFGLKANYLSGSTSNTTVVLDPLPPSNAGEFYLLTLYAYSGQLLVGEIMTVGANGGHGWDLRFTVPPPGVTFNVTPSSTIFPMTPAPNNVINHINGTVTNATNVTQTNILIQNNIDQGNLTTPAGGAVISSATAPQGEVPPMTILQLATNTVPATASGTGAVGMVPGPAILRVDLMQNGQLLQEATFPITLTSP